MATEACCAAGTQVFFDPAWTERGSMAKTAGGVDVYMSGEDGRPTVLILHDVFGIGPQNLRANCDALAAAGFLVCMPDFFAGNKIQDMPGGASVENIAPFLMKHGGSEAARKTLSTEVIPFLHGRGCSKIFVLGYCWGGRIALELAADEELSCAFAASAGVHAALKDEAAACANARGARIPMMLLQAGNDPDVRPVKDALWSGDAALRQRHIVRTFFEVDHGFAANRGDRKDPRVRSAALSALQMAVDFFRLASDTNGAAAL
eukprot:gnl/TRDRNA2_/TRDRNA2_34630_c0_seq1.p1 gnl/TRDRNA2_/TRDRNA2_34630_c0~~gnl/TRDRNA2_/TRDRNA2_34630_c0_seq1.p1  ORF type:complete len:281 (+),score=47.87 gnl/TRDRNA2_/TRDRNA2_34630_c0_seq1:58-843(+)